MAGEMMSNAIQVMRLGLSVFPCANSGSRAKAPLVARGWKAASRDENHIREFWMRHPFALVAVPTGKLNGITVLDVDRKNNVDGFASLERRGFDLSTFEGPIVTTPTGGVHLYFKYTPDLRNSAGKLGPGLDVRNDGGYVIVAGEIIGQGRYQAVGL